eukprot:1185102-Prorocentrum_minimum.AAC.1
MFAYAGGGVVHWRLQGGAHGDDEHDPHGREGALQASVPARHGARRPRPEDEQVAGQRHRPAAGKRVTPRCDFDAVCP